MIKMLTIAKKKKFSRANIFIQNSSISFNRQALFDFKNEFIISIWQDVKLLKRWDITAI